MKTHHSAVVLLPPEPLWPPIQEIRSRHDRQFHRWMPHLNLLYPFRSLGELGAATPLLLDALRAVSPFTLTLRRFHFFGHGAERFTLWLAPEPEGPVLALQAALQAAFPDCDDLSRFKGGFHPHLSVGQVSGRLRLERLTAALQAAWQPLTFEVTGVAVICRRGEDPFRIERRLPLGDAT